MNHPTPSPHGTSASPSAPRLQPTVIYFARIGDMIMLSALLDFLHRRYRKPCQIIGAGSANAALYEGNPDVERIWSFHRHLPFPLSADWRQAARALRASHPGPIYVCEHHYRQLPRVRRMLAFSRVDTRRCVFILEEPGRGKNHSVDRLVRLGEQTPELLDAADFPLPTATHTWAPRLQVFDADRLERDAWLSSQGWAGRQLIIVQPGNHRTMSRRRKRWRRLATDDKAWPLERWVELLHRIHARMPDALIMLRGSHEETRMLQQIHAATRLDSVAVVVVGLRLLFALCEAAHSMISVDTGPAHAAAALGLPLVVMYGAESQRFWLPRSLSGSPVIGVGGPPETVRADQIPVDAVFDAWCTVLARMEASPRRQHAGTPAQATFGKAESTAPLSGGARA